MNIFVELGQNDDFQIGVTTAIVTTVASVIISFATYLIKRIFAKKDFEDQQKTEHSSWLLKQSHSFAEKYYVFLTRHLYEFDDRFKQALLSKNDNVIKTTYEHLTLFLKKYNEFKIETGGNFLFIERSNEMKAIRKIQSLFFTLPFDDEDIQSILENTSIRARDSFTSWIKSDNCKKSQTLVKERIFQLWPLLDDESEKIMHYEYFLKFNKKRKKENRKKRLKLIMNKLNILHKQKKIQNNNVFHIRKVEPRYIVPGGKILIFGRGFSVKNISYDIKIKEEKLQKLVMDDTLIEVLIPNTLTEGTYDITADFKINEMEGNEPMGLVIHITK